MKKALLPILLMCGAMLVLIAVAYWYSQKESDDWPFKSGHHHGSTAEEMHEHEQDHKH